MDASTLGYFYMAVNVTKEKLKIDNNINYKTSVFDFNVGYLTTVFLGLCFVGLELT